MISIGVILLSLLLVSFNKFSSNHTLLFAGVLTNGADLYVSRKSGNDNWPCDLSSPCETILRAVNLASSEDHIYLDGANTNKNPYTCHVTQPHTGTLYINKSLTFVRFGSIPQIRCLNWTIFDGSNSGLEVNVTLSELLINDTVVTFRDSSAVVDGCEFVGNKQRIVFTVANKSFVCIRIWNSLFRKNSSGLSVAVGSTERRTKSHVVLDVKDTIFRDKFVVSEVEIGNLIKIQSRYSVGFDLRLDNVTFSNNLVSRMGLVYVNVMNGNLNIFLKDVFVTGNNHLCSFGDCTELIIESNNVSAIISRAFFLGLSGRALSITATNL